MKHVIQCLDCGADYETGRANTKYCALCRLFRDLVYLNSRTAKCVSCAEKFAVRHTNDKLCSKCDFLAENNPRGKCGVCNRPDGVLVKGGLALCMTCVKDPELRTVVLEAIGRKRQRRIKGQEVAA